MSSIIILRGGYSKPISDSRTTVLSLEEFRNRIFHFDFFPLLFHFDEARLLTPRLSIMTKPLNMALIMRSLSRGPCLLEDEEGNKQRIGFGTLATFVQRALKDFVDKRGLLRRTRQEIHIFTNDAKNRTKAERKLDLSARPVYLRTDLIFGLRAGGSLAHISGVLNHLDSFTNPPLFLTTDIIPTVRRDIETSILSPPTRFWDFRELPIFYFNEVACSECEKYLKKEKIAFIYQRYSLNNYTGLKLAIRTGVPLVLEYNGSETWMSRHWGKSLKYESLTEQIELLNINGADVVVVVSQPMKDELINRGIEANKILVDPNGVDPDRYSPIVDRTDIRNQYYLDGKTVIGFIGTFGKWHGAEILAEAFGRLLLKYPEYRSKIKLFMIGDGITMPLVKQNVSKFCIKESCVLTGLIPQEEGPKYLAACDVLVASHKPNPDGTPFFGSPTKLFEYMAMGKGIVASDLNQIGEVLKHDYSAWLVKPGDSESLMNGLKVLVDDEQRRVKLGKAAREEVIAKYTWREHTRRIIEKLKERYG
jgi:glycosyltransferase involved in cell wall biosynthesis